MLRTPVAEALGAASAASEIRIGGWGRARRDAQGVSFLEINDGSCLRNLQCIFDGGTAGWGQPEGVQPGAGVRGTGAGPGATSIGGWKRSVVSRSESRTSSRARRAASREGSGVPTVAHARVALSARERSRRGASASRVPCTV